MALNGHRFSRFWTVLIPVLLLVACDRPTPATPPKAPPAPPPPPSFAGIWLCETHAWILEVKNGKATGTILSGRKAPQDLSGTVADVRLDIETGKQDSLVWHGSLTLQEQAGRLRWMSRVPGEDEALEVRRLGAPGDELVPLLAAALRSDEPFLRKGAARVLGGLGPQALKALPSVIERLQDPDPRVVLEARLSISQIGRPDPETLPLLRCLLQDSSARVRAAAADAMAALGFRAASAAGAVATLVDDPAPEVRTAAAWAIGRLGAAGISALKDFIDGEGPEKSTRARELLRQLEAPRNADSAPPDPSLGYWPEYRGHRRDNLSRDTGLLKNWPPEGPPLIWDVRGIGDGIAPVAVREGRIYTMGYSNGLEFLSALEETSGRLLWSSPLGPSIREFSGMRWLAKRTPTVDRDLVFAFRADGMLICLRTRDGHELWRKDYASSYGTEHPWIQVDHPLVDGELLIGAPRGPLASLVGLDKFTGQERWRYLHPNQPGQSWGAPLAIEGSGGQQILCRLGKVLVALKSSDGSLLWIQNDPLTPTATPLRTSKGLLLTSTYDNDTYHLLDLEPPGFGAPVGPLKSHRNPKLTPAFLQDSALVFENHLYYPTTKGIACIELGTSTPTWVSPDEGALTLADGYLYVYTTTGRLQLIEAAPRELRVKGSLPVTVLRSLHTDRMVTPPVVTGGRLYVRENDRLLCFDVRAGGTASAAQAPVLRYLPDLGLPQGKRDPLPPAVYVPTPPEVVKRMLDLAGISKADFVIDLGSGDGRIPIEAVRRGARAGGVELNPALVKLSRENIAKEGFQDRIRITEGDLFEADLSKATLITAYLPPEFLERLIPRFNALAPGTRIVTHQARIPGVQADLEALVEAAEDGREHPVYLWTTPLRRSLDWPMAGRDATRNAVSPESNPPTAWSLEKGREKNLAWKSPLGDLSFSSPVVAGGIVWAGTNNGAPRDPSRREDGGVLMAFRERDGLFLGQRLSPRRTELPAMSDYSHTPLRGSPLIEGERLWYLDNRWEVVCLDSGALKAGPATPRELWKADLVERFGVLPLSPGMANGPACSIGASLRNRIYVSTGNGLDWATDKPARPKAPALVCLDKNSGETLGWEASGICSRSVWAEWSSPLALDLPGGGVVLYGGGDGFLYAFDPEPNPVTKILKERWRTDCNPTDQPRLAILATPVVADKSVYVLIGQEVDNATSPGALTCVDLETGKLRWQKPLPDGSIASPVVHGGVVYALETTGIVHAVEARTGRPLWSHDFLSMTPASPLIADERLFVGTFDEELVTFDLRNLEFGKKPSPPTVTKSGYVRTAPLLSHGTLYLASDRMLYAIRDAGEGGGGPPDPIQRGRSPSALFVPTPEDVIEKMLSVRELRSDDLLIDLGSGDGRIPIAAARLGFRAVGYELDAELVRISKQKAQVAGVFGRVRFVQEDLLRADLKDAQIITLYLGDRLNALLLPKLKALQHAACIVSHEFLLPGIPPEKTLKMISKADGREHKIHLWTTPLKDPK